jgi:hypothetical protein
VPTPVPNLPHRRALCGQRRNARPKQLLVEFARLQILPGQTGRVIRNAFERCPGLLLGVGELSGNVWHIPTIQHFVASTNCAKRQFAARETNWPEEKRDRRTPELGETGESRGESGLGLCMAILRKMRLLPKITFCLAAVAPMNGS